MMKRLLVLMALACGLAWPAAAEEMDKVSVGLVITLSQSPYYIALEKGYFATERIEPAEASFRGAQDSVSSLATGQLDISLGALNAGFFNAANKGLDLRVVAALGIQPSPVSSTPLLARKDLWDSGAIKSGADLKGRIVATNTPGSIPEYLLTIILERYGMSLKDVNETMLGFPQMVVALRNKAVDAAFIGEPLATMAIKQGSAALVVPEAGTGAGEITTVVFFSGKFLRERAGVGERFLRALVRAAHETQGPYNKNPELVPLIVKASKLDPTAIQDCNAFAFDPNLDIAKFVDSLHRQESVHMKNGRLDYKEPLDLAKVVDASLVHKAAASLK